MTRCTAVVLAGSRPSVDPFAQAYGTDLKALIPVGGVPMVRRPVTALLESAGVATVAGTAYGLSPYFRLSIATAIETLEEGCARIARAVAELR